MRTVRDFKESILPAETPLEARQEFFYGRNDRRAFWNKLCNIAWERRTKSSDETADDVYATCPLTDTEWMNLKAEFELLERKDLGRILGIR